MRGIGLRIAIIGAFIVGGIILRPFVSGNASELTVGDCFDEPANKAATVEDVQHRPCTDAHDAEVVFVGNYTPKSDTFPTDDAFRTFFQSACTAAFSSYTGIDFMTDQTYDMSAFTPTSDGWSKGDNKVICYAVRLDGTKLSATIKKG